MGQLSFDAIDILIHLEGTCKVGEGLLNTPLRTGVDPEYALISLPLIL